MGSSARIDGYLPAFQGDPNTGLVYGGGWAATYDWVGDHVTTNSPKRLSDLGFPSAFNGTLEGVIRGQGVYAGNLYLFANGQYLAVDEATLAPTGSPQATAPAWDLPADWTGFDAVFSGAGTKSGFSYFLRKGAYCRYDWSKLQRSPDYPKNLGTEWHLSPPFASEVDGVVIGQGPSYGTKAYVFTTEVSRLDNFGNNVATGGVPVTVPVYATYDFDTGTVDNVNRDPFDVVTTWNGLLPILDAGPAIDLAVTWCDGGLNGLGNRTSLVNTALQHHFRMEPPTDAELAFITDLLTKVRDRLKTLPDIFEWQRIPSPARTYRLDRTEIGDGFSQVHGPNGRAAVLIHEAVHFFQEGAGPFVDILEWSGETINGQPQDIDGASNRSYSSLTRTEALTNPSSYAAYVQEVGYTQDTRFGFGRPHE